MNEIAKPNDAWTRMSEAWDLVDTLNGGTRAMRKAAQKYLPTEQVESPASYSARLARSVLHGGYAKIVKDLVGKPFSREVALVFPQAERGAEPYGLPEELAHLEADCDNMGTGLTEFCSRVMHDAIDHGVSWVLVEYPPKPAGMDALAQKTLGFRPYFVHITAKQLIGWTEEKSPNGSKRPTSIKWTECVAVPTDTGEEEIEQIRRMTFTYADTPERVGTWEVWRKSTATDAGEVWQIAESGTHTFVGLPLHPLWLGRKAHMEAYPVLEDVAWLNLAHWQSDSDQRNNLRFSRIGILFGAGFSEDERKAGFKIAPNALVGSNNPQATLSYVEQSGAALSAGRQDLQDIEARMEIHGLAPLMERRVNDQTATGAALDASDSMSDLQTWARLEERQFEACFASAAAWATSPQNPVEIPEGFRVDIFSEFSIPFSDAAGITGLVQLWQAGGITHKTMLQEVKRRGFVSGTLDVEEEIEGAGQERPLSSFDDPSQDPADDSQDPPADSGKADDKAPA